MSKVTVVTWSHPDGSGGTLGAYATERAADIAIFQDRGYCDPYSPCAVASRPEKRCKTHNRPIEEAFGNWKAWVYYDKQEFEILSEEDLKA